MTKEERRNNIAILVARSKQNDEQAMEELVILTQKKALFNAKFIINDDILAEDIVQDAYMTAFQKLDTLSDLRDFEPWLHKIIRNKALDYYKRKETKTKNKSRNFSEFDVYGDPEEDTNFEETLRDENGRWMPEENVDYQEVKDGLTAVINGLNPNQRDAILSFYYYQSSIKEIAAEQGVSENTVKGWLNYGRKNIKAKIEDLRAHNKSFYSIAPIPFFVQYMGELEKTTRVMDTDVLIRCIKKGAGFAGKYSAASSGKGTAGSTGKDTAGTINNSSFSSAGKSTASSVGKGIASAAEKAASIGKGTVGSSTAHKTWLTVKSTIAAHKVLSAVIAVAVGIAGTTAVVHMTRPKFSACDSSKYPEAVYVDDELGDDYLENSQTILKNYSYNNDYDVYTMNPDGYKAVAKLMGVYLNQYSDSFDGENMPKDAMGLKYTFQIGSRSIDKDKTHIVFIVKCSPDSGQTTADALNEANAKSILVVDYLPESSDTSKAMYNKAQKIFNDPDLSH